MGTERETKYDVNHVYCFGKFFGEENMSIVLLIQLSIQIQGQFGTNSVVRLPTIFHTHHIVANWKFAMLTVVYTLQ